MAKKEHVRLYAVMMISESFGWHHAPRIVSAFDTRGQARYEMRDLRNEGERWWVQAGTFTPDATQKRAATKSRDAKRAVATVGAKRKK